MTEKWIAMRTLERDVLNVMGLWMSRDRPTGFVAAASYYEGSTVGNLGYYLRKRPL